MWASVMRRIETATRRVACMRRDWMASIVGDSKPSHVVFSVSRASCTSRLVGTALARSPADRSIMHTQNIASDSSASHSPASNSLERV